MPSMYNAQVSIASRVGATGGCDPEAASICCQPAFDSGTLGAALVAARGERKG